MFSKAQILFMQCTSRKGGVQVDELVTSFFRFLLQFWIIWFTVLCTFLSRTNILKFWFVLNTGSWGDSSSLLIVLWLVRLFLLQFDNCPFSFSVWLPGKVYELMFLVLFLKRINVRILVISFVELWDCKSFQGYES